MHALLLTLLAAPPDPVEREFFEKLVRPLLVQHCYSCHSTEAKKQRGGLRLDQRDAILKGGDSGPALLPGKPDESLLLRAVRYQHDQLHMPPKGRLPERDVAVLAEWIRRGAYLPDAALATTNARVIDIKEGKKFWSFQPLNTTAVLELQQQFDSRSPIDAFVGVKRQAARLEGSPEADRRTLLRRLSFDLIGLPPTPDEMSAAFADTSPDWYEKQVDRLLASPRHGERWARWWLDLARYCDIPEEWVKRKGQPYVYRDWVVRTLNEDLPYDRFVTYQLAADQASGATVADRAALGFLGLSPVYWKELKLDKDVIKNVVAEEWEERIHTVGSTFLGLTIACARCHDHKFDAITQQDYYALAGVFASIREADVAAGATSVPGVDDASLHVLPDGPHKTKLDYKPGVAQDVAVQVRGNPANVGPVVPRRFLAVLSPEALKPFRAGSGRLELAQAIINDAAPLTARVVVNRVWMHHFGQGLVDTPSDFGAQGSRPSHPELLDDLARRFIASGWSLRWLHREIVLSATYRQASSRDPNRQALDPDNRLLWRMNRRRLDVESWRDAVLASNGTLDSRIGGPPQDLSDLKNERRTVYGTVKRRELNDLLRLHDFPDPTTHSAARLPTTTALQQLFVLNSPFVAVQAAALARRVQSEASDDPARIRRAYQLLFNRTPSEREARVGIDFLKTAGDSGWTQYAQILLGSNEMVFVD